MELEGLREMTERLELLKRSGENKAALAGARAAAREIEKGIKAAIPGEYRSARRAIGRKVKKVLGEVQAKVGAGVGKKSKAKPNRKKSGGVGLSKENIHWAILGVNQRSTKAGHNRGRHDGFLKGIVQQGANAALVRAAVAMRDKIAEVLAQAIRR